MWLHCGLTCSELRRLLKRQGCIFVEGKKHTFALLNGLSATFPRHGKAEIKTGTLHSVLAALGLKLSDLK